MIHEGCGGELIKCYDINANVLVFAGEPVRFCNRCRKKVHGLHDPKDSHSNKWCRLCEQKIPGVFQPATGSGSREKCPACKAILVEGQAAIENLLYAAQRSPEGFDDAKADLEKWVESLRVQVG